ncbi:MAG: hypothetical protein J6T99_00945 [Oscillospiraceae bacterium]|nr:hypothetical protein [Oscillospiraceae bacterium]
MSIIFELATAVIVFVAATTTPSPWITAALIVAGAGNLISGIVDLYRLRKEKQDG